MNLNKTERVFLDKLIWRKRTEEKAMYLQSLSFRYLAVGFHIPI